MNHVALDVGEFPVVVRGMMTVVTYIVGDDGLPPSVSVSATRLQRICTGTPTQIISPQPGHARAGQFLPLPDAAEPVQGDEALLQNLSLASSVSAESDA